MKIYSIRGATTVEENNEASIRRETIALLKNIIESNNLNKSDIYNVLFTCTRDIDKVYPAKFAREVGFSDIPLMCFQEMHVQGSLKMCIRVMINVCTENEVGKIKHVYLKRAKKLRPDLND